MLCTPWDIQQILNVVSIYKDTFSTVASFTYHDTCFHIERLRYVLGIEVRITLLNHLVIFSTSNTHFYAGVGCVCPSVGQEMILRVTGLDKKYH